MTGDLPSQPKATILVVDDEAAVRRVLVMRLQLSGYRVICAEDGEQALEMFHNESPDLVVLDVMLPKLDGFAVCRRLRAESCVPIIFLSAVEAISERVAGLDLGADDYLPKPFSPKELEARIATILRRVGRGNAVVESRANCPRGRAFCGSAIWWWTPTDARSPVDPSASTSPTPSSACWSCCSATPAMWCRGPKFWSSSGVIPLAVQLICAWWMSTWRGCAENWSLIPAIPS